MNSGGDVLARGARSAQFGTGDTDLSEFETDIALGRDGLEMKYGISTVELGDYVTRREAGERFDLKPVGTGTLSDELTVVDKRYNYLAEPVEVKSIEKTAPKFPAKTYGEFSPILDRLLIKRCHDENLEILEDGSARDKKTGFIIAAKYRQHSNTGIVLATGKFVVLGGHKIPMEEVVRVGDRVTYGDYNSEVFPMDQKIVVQLCDAVQMNYEEDEEGTRIVRVQDVRGIEREVTNG